MILFKPRRRASYKRAMSSDADLPLALFFDQTNKVLLAAFSGVFTLQVTIDLDTAARALAALHGPFAVILDFTKVTELALQLRDWPQFATNRRAIRGTRRGCASWASRPTPVTKRRSR